METARKITVDVPPDLLEKAQRATGSGITQTVRTGLELVALIAQTCIDRGIPLLARDRDFRAFAGAAGLDLV
jgi:predicted nucleic acid-binding protein